jgi:hypothetical protein
MVAQSLDDWWKEYSSKNPKIKNWNPNKGGVDSIYNVRQPNNTQSTGTSAMANGIGNISNTYGELKDPFANMYSSRAKTEDDWTKAYKEMNSWAMPVEDNSFAEQQNEDNFDPFQDFKFGMNMPTFQLGKGVLDTGSNLLNVFNQFRDYGLRKDMFGKQMEMADKQYADAKDIQNIKFDNIDHNSAVLNNFTDHYGGPDGNYIKRAPVNRRALG